MPIARSGPAAGGGTLARAVLAGAIALGAGCRTGSPAGVAVPVRPPHLAATRFVAYGDSITEGFVRRCPGATADRAAGAGVLNVQPRAQVSPVSYPSRLQALLLARYPSQAIRIINEGRGGEEIDQAVADLPRVLTADEPAVLLLQEGVNTLNQRHREGIPLVVQGIRTMIQEARSRGITVFVGTLLPQRPGGCRSFDVAEDFDDIIETNVLLRRAIGTEGAQLVDLYEAFNGQNEILIGEDGLHPSALGYDRIASAFLDAIVDHLEDK